MANVVFLTDIEQVDASISTAQLTDITNYNTQGVLRSTLALYAFLYKRDANSSDTQIALDNSNPLSVTFWQFNLPSQDGIFVAQIFGIPIWSAGTYTQNQCVYYSGNVYYVNASSTTQTPGGADWTIIPTANIPSVIPGLSSNNVSQTQTYNFSAAHSATGVMANSLADLGLQIKDGRCKNWNQAAGVLTGAALIDSAWTNFRAGNYITCQQIMDYLQATTALPI